MQRTLFANACVAISLVVLLSGCVGGGAQDVPASSGAPKIPEAAGPATFGESTGAIQGLITDDQIQPVPGAQVGIVELSYSTITDIAGNFVLSNLAPGRYSLSASALGYNAAARSVEVVAGELTEVNLVLQPIPIVVPYAELFPFTGYIACAFAFIRSTYTAIPYVGNQCDQDESASTFQWIYGHEEGDGWPLTWAATLVEAEWDSNANPDWLAFDYNDRDIGYTGVYFRYRGTSPVRFLVERCGDYRENDFGRAPAPCTDEEVESSRMRIDTFYVGKYQEETHNLDAACTGNITNPQGGNLFPGYQAGCYGVGPGLNIRWQNWVTVFHLELPDDIDVYSARPDA